MDVAEICYVSCKWLPDSKNGEFRPFILKEVVGWLVGWFINLIKLAKIAIYELIWLKGGMEVLNGS